MLPLVFASRSFLLRVFLDVVLSEAPREGTSKLSILGRDAGGFGNALGDAP